MMSDRQLKWDRRFLEMCDHLAQWSKDPSTKVGAVITDGIKVISHGFNGLPAKIFDDANILNDRIEKYKYIIHAEMNAILTADCPSLKGCTLYVAPFLPCTNCASMVIQSGITRVVSPVCVDDRWMDNINDSRKLFNQAGVEVIEYEN